MHQPAAPLRGGELGGLCVAPAAAAVLSVSPPHAGGTRSWQQLLPTLHLAVPSLLQGVPHPWWSMSIPCGAGTGASHCSQLPSQQEEEEMRGCYPRRWGEPRCPVVAQLG